MRSVLDLSRYFLILPIFLSASEAVEHELFTCLVMNESLPGKCATIVQEINSILYYSRPTGNFTTQRLTSYVSTMTSLELSTKRKK